MKVNLAILTVILLVSKIFGLGNVKNKPNTIEQVHVIFRHGERFPDLYCTPLSPNETFWPDGYGALTKVGKQQEYDIGVTLRERYGEWLGDIYYPEILSALTTDNPRTKMSLQLVLAGLWPPAVEQTWNWDINWQPIPYDYLSKFNDTLLGSAFHCPTFNAEFSRLKNTTEVQKIIKTKQQLINYVLSSTDVDSFLFRRTNPLEYMFGLYFCLSTMDQMKVPLPKWTEPVYPVALEEIACLLYQLVTYNDVLKQHFGGQFIKKVLDDAKNKMSGKLVPKERKIFLYSAHEYNIATILRGINSFVPHIPPYGAYIIFEVHKIKEVYGFKTFYQNYKEEDPLPIIIPGCDTFCSIDKFVQIIGNHLPDPKLTCTP